MAEAMVSDAEKKKNELVHDAEAAAQTRLNELKQQITDEEYRLQKAKEATAAYVQQVTQAHQGALDYLARLGELTAGVILPAEPTALCRKSLCQPHDSRSGGGKGARPCGRWLRSR